MSGVWGTEAGDRRAVPAYQVAVESVPRPRIPRPLYAEFLPYDRGMAHSSAPRVPWVTPGAPYR